MCENVFENPCMFREVSSKELVQVLNEFLLKSEYTDKWFGNLLIVFKIICFTTNK
jgi:hypothetical protein